MRKENECKRKGGGKRGGSLGRSLSGTKGAKSPIPMNEPQPVREKLVGCLMVVDDLVAVDPTAGQLRPSW